jgi:hypothetical protein
MLEDVLRLEEEAKVREEIRCKEALAWEQENKIQRLRQVWQREENFAAIRRKVHQIREQLKGLDTYEARQPLNQPEI